MKNGDPIPNEKSSNDQAMPVGNSINLGSIIGSSVNKATDIASAAAEDLIHKDKKKRGGLKATASKDAAKSNKKKKAEKAARKKQRKNK